MGARSASPRRWVCPAIRSTRRWTDRRHFEARIIVTTGQRRRLPIILLVPIHANVLISRVYRKPILKLACGCTRLLSYFPSPSYLVSGAC